MGAVSDGDGGAGGRRGCCGAAKPDGLGLPGGSQLPLGWSGGWDQNWHGWLPVVGWALTAFAVSLGAGFWFDALGKLLQLRSTGVKVSPVNGNVQELGA